MAMVLKFLISCVDMPAIKLTDKLAKLIRRLEHK